MARHVVGRWLAWCLPLLYAVRKQPQSPTLFLQRSTPSDRNQAGFQRRLKFGSDNVTSKASKKGDNVLKKVSRENATEEQPGLPGLFASRYQRCEAIAMYPPNGPEVCTRGKDTWNETELLLGLNYFVHMWRVYQAKFSHLCCTGVNHLFPVFFTSGTFQPPAIIQVGVTSGQMTWWLRNAVPDAQIFAIERIDPMMVYSGLTDVWIDDDPKTKYFTGANFVDALELDWKTLIPDARDRAATLVILSDHRSCMEQFKTLQAQGFRRFLYMDNYPYQVATSAEQHTCKDTALSAKRDYPEKHMYGDAYTPSAICDRRLDTNTTSVLYKDRAGKVCREIKVAEHQKNLRYMQQNTAKYFEFPPVYTKCANRYDVARNRQQLLHETEMPAMFPKAELEVIKYGHLFPVYVELVSTPGDSGDVGPNAPLQPRTFDPPPPIEKEDLGEASDEEELAE